MRLHEIFSVTEAHHAYDDVSYNTEFQPLKVGDTVRVFHGFWSMTDAVGAAKHGLSGAMPADRRYSYENNNNPKGLFVSLKLDIAKEFTNSVIVEFVAREDELEAPVWPGNGYTVQGQMAQYFPHGAAGRAARRSARRAGIDAARARAGDDPYRTHVAASDDPYKAELLMLSREHQALFVGHLNPGRIDAFWVNDNFEKSGRFSTWSRLSVEEFLARFGQEDKTKSEKIFRPEDDFDPEVFAAGLAAQFRKRDTAATDKLLRDIVRFYVDPQGRKIDGFVDFMERFLWPKQYGPAFKWLLRHVKTPKPGDRPGGE